MHHVFGEVGEFNEMMRPTGEVVEKPDANTARQRRKKKFYLQHWLHVCVGDAVEAHNGFY